MDVSPTRGARARRASAETVQSAAASVSAPSTSALLEEGFATAPDGTPGGLPGHADAARGGIPSTEDDLKRIRDAYRVSDAAHLGQFRQSGEPYVSHPIAVAETCARWKLDAESLMAALMHDVIEDSGVTKQEL
jgi:hypothetical protein